MTRRAPSLRVALLAGSLTQGGAEKQLVYMVRALREREVDVRVYCLTRGEFYEAALEQLSVGPEWIGRHANPLVRTMHFAYKLRAFRPQVVQAAHFFTNLHVTLAARLVGAQAVGSLRNDTVFEVGANGRWGPFLLRTPPVLMANSAAAVNNAAALGADSGRIYVVPNVLDLAEFDRSSAPADPHRTDRVVAVAACRLVRAKRVDRFLEALALARRETPQLHGVVVGDGPERGMLERIAQQLRLRPDGVTFAGRRDDVPSVLRSAHVLVVSSDHEGFPNVLLEAMAARLPVVTTPAGDAARIVRDGETGFVVPFDDTGAMAKRLVDLGTKAELRRRLGDAGRTEVERRYSPGTLGDTLLATYGAIGARCRHGRLATALAHSTALAH
jgi:glycosyltransferase involved in cell wall biosynthesis